MKFVLISNILEHEAFADFVRAAIAAYPGAEFLVAGDLLNIFPEPGEDLQSSIFYELYGDTIITEMNKLVETKFKHPEESGFIKPLQEMFSPLGDRFQAAQDIAWKRYQKLFATLEKSIEGSKFHFIPGNMDYPQIGSNLTKNSYRLHQIDRDVFERDGVRIAGLGGIPNTVHPFKGVVEISPYEMSEVEYASRLHRLWGVDVLVTHVCPEECPIVNNFLDRSPLKLLICRAPFNFRKQSDFRGQMEIESIDDKCVIKVRPFDYPSNHAFVIDLLAGEINPPSVEVFSWDDVGG
jgi:Icc-related predicted phosphoesterase